MHSISIVQGSTSVVLSGPSSAAPFAGARMLAAADAGDTVREVVELALEGTAADIETALERVARLVNAARERAALPGAGPVYLTATINAGGTAWRTKLVDGWIDYPKPGAAGRTLGAQAARINLERESFWEGPEAQLPLTNPNGAATLNYLTVYNCADGTGAAPNVRVNWVAVAGLYVSGDLPAPCRLELKNNVVGSAIGQAWVGHTWRSTAHYTSFLEAEAAAGKTGAADATCSGGQKVTVSLPSGVETSLFQWTIAADMLNEMQGGQACALARFAPFGVSDIKFRLNVYSLGALVWQGEQILQPAGALKPVREVGWVRLPPTLLGLGGMAALVLELTGEQSTGGAVDVVLDGVFLLPADGWQAANVAGGGLGSGSSLVLDGLNEYAYLSGTGGIAPWVAQWGAPLGLRPGVDQQIFFAMNGAKLGNSSPITNNCGVKLFYRPRRRAL